MESSVIFEKFKDLEKINVIFLGGSITWGCGASEKSKCFANMTGEWLKTVFGADYPYGMSLCVRVAKAILI